MPAKLVVSLDFELLWGVRDHADRETYGANILGARKAIPPILELFEKYGVAATWATVGFVFCGSRDELMANLPPEDLRPTYQDSRLSAYGYLGEIGADEKRDPFYFGASLIDRIRQTPRQEIGTHTLSHYYCLEPGQTPTQFEADLKCAVDVAEQRKVKLNSIVFPRNQYSVPYLELCRKFGLTTYRGTPGQWIYQSSPRYGQNTLRRAGRLIDAHTGMFGDTSFADDPSIPADVPASHFLRPCAGRLADFHPMHCRAIRKAMTRAAQNGRGYHLWWHPHNFGKNIEVNLRSLEGILTHYRRLHDEFGMQSRTMAEAAE